MDFDKEHAEQWMLDHLWEYFPEKRIAYTEESLVILDEMFQDYVDEYYTTFVSDTVYDKETRSLSVSLTFGKRNEKILE